MPVSSDFISMDFNADWLWNDLGIMIEVTFYAYLLKCIAISVPIKYSTVKAVKSLALKVRSLLASLLLSALYNFLFIQLGYNSLKNPVKDARRIRCGNHFFRRKLQIGNSCQIITKSNFYQRFLIN